MLNAHFVSRFFAIKKIACYGGEVSLEFRDFTLSPMVHLQVQLAAESSRWVADQNKFWEYHDLVFANQKLDRSSLFSCDETFQKPLRQNSQERRRNLFSPKVKVQGSQEHVVGTVGVARV